MGDEFGQRINGAVAQAKQLNAGGLSMGLAIYKAAEEHQLGTDCLARVMAKRSVKRRSWIPKKKPYVRKRYQDYNFTEEELRRDTERCQR